MKQMLLATSTLILAGADVGLKTGYNYDSNKNVPQTYYPQQQEQQLQDLKQTQYPTQNIIPNAFPKPNTQYLPSPQVQYQTQAQVQYQHNPEYVATQKQQQQQQQQFAIPLPMPSDFPAKFNYQPSINTKTSRRYRPRVRIPKKPIISKHFFIHSAPEETQTEIDEELDALQQQPRKHYNVLFVKAPSQTNQAAALNLAKALKEEKTVVYVLAKKTSAADLQDALKESPQHINKPEVFFIRYRTPEEAANAQQQIQSQYDSLGGSTIISDEGIAPASSVVGSLDSFDEEYEEEQQQLQPQQPQLQQLPQQTLAISQEQIHATGNYGEHILMNSLSSTNNNKGYLPPLKQN